MAVLLFDFRHVPNDEIEEVRALLSAHDINFYETPPNRWGISAGAIWLKDESQLQYAKQLIKNYQIQRSENARDDYEQLRKAGETESVLDRLKQRPIQFILYGLIISIVLYFSIAPFLKLGE